MWPFKSKAEQLKRTPILVMKCPKHGELEGGLRFFHISVDGVHHKFCMRCMVEFMDAHISQVTEMEKTE